MRFYEDLDEYRFVKFEKSKKKFKKYDAVFEHKKTGKKKIISFGSLRENFEPYNHYKDTTGLGIYSKWDHNDLKRRKLYRMRHGFNDFHKIIYSPSWFSWNYLWN